MGAPKLRPSDYAKLYQAGPDDKTLHEKKIVESLQKRLNDMIQRDPKLAKKAALVIEQWLKKSKP